MTLPPKSTVASTRVPAAMEAGLLHRNILCVLLQDNLAYLAPAQRRAAAEWLEDLRDKQGWLKIIIYGWDEPSYPLAGLRKIHLPMGQLPVRMVTDLGAQGTYGHGDLHDIWVVIGGVPR